MTQQDIIHELNRLVVGYNLNWDTVKTDADRAIMKINAYLGAEYPMMSKIMVSPKHRYTIKLKGVERPIFPERYILTVVIPYIASEVLARDEEFTTIYNKYAMDFENGLFDMFQNEYNKVPPVFRQDSDVGVFFTEGTPEYVKQKEKPVFDFSFNVYYDFNFDEYYNTQKFTTDLSKYPFGSTAVVKDSTVQEFISGIYAYTFKGWSRDKFTPNVIYSVGDTITDITEDIYLYAVWEKDCVLKVTNNKLEIKPEYISKVKYLNIPAHIEGVRFSSIASNFAKDASNLVSVTLPNVDFTIEAHAFSNATLTELVFPDYDYLRNKPSIVIQSGAIHNTSIMNLYIPYSVATITVSGISGVPYIQCEVDPRPESYHTNFANTYTKIEWGVPNG